MQGYYPPNTLIFSYYDDLSTQCAKYEDWRGNCPRDSPRVFATKYSKSIHDIFNQRSETRSAITRRLKEIKDRVKSAFRRH